MPRNVNLIRVFVASPDDTSVERQATREVIDLINKSELDGTEFRLDPVMFETDITPGFGSDPQAVINEQVHDDFDIFVGLLKGKFGTPTPRAGSGTEEEFRRAYNRWRSNNRGSQIMFYFGNQDISTAQLDQATLLELMKVKELQSEIGSLGGVYHEYENIQGFRDSLRSHLVRKVREYGKTWGPEEENTFNTQFSDADEDFEEPTLIDLAADAEEAMETYAASVTRMTSALSLLSESMQKRTSEANKMKVQTGVSAKRVRGFLRGTADDITAVRTLIGSELAIYTSSWAVFKDRLLKIISRSNVVTDDDRAAATNVSRNLHHLYDAMETALTSTQTLLESVSSLSGNKDINRSTRELADTLTAFIRETTRMMVEIRDIQSGLDGMTGE